MGSTSRSEPSNEVTSLSTPADQIQYMAFMSLRQKQLASSPSAGSRRVISNLDRSGSAGVSGHSVANYRKSQAIKRFLEIGRSLPCWQRACLLQGPHGDQTSSP